MGEQTTKAGTGLQTILVVDDDPSTLLLCSRKLQAEGFQVLEASGSSEGLQLCSQHKGDIHLLLTDLLLPPPCAADGGREEQFSPDPWTRISAQSAEIKATDACTFDLGVHER